MAVDTARRNPHSPVLPPAPTDKSQLTHRRVIGILGFVLPAGLYLLAGMRPTKELQTWAVLDSVSAYYYTGSVAVFVGVLFALSLFLFTYRGYTDAKADRVVGVVGGASALSVALFPATAPEGISPPTWWHETTGFVHYGAAATLFISFILFSLWLFRKSNIPNWRDRPLEKRYRDAVCLVCGLLMIVCVLWAATSMFTHARIFLPEAIAIEAFAISWLAKGDAHGALARVTTRLVRRVSKRGAQV